MSKIRKDAIVSAISRNTENAKKNGIPDRWLNYTKVGNPVQGTPFVAFKVPLNKYLCSKLDYYSYFSTDCLIQYGPKLKLIIDLTNTSRYYNPQEFTEQGINYRKIYCPGQIVPPAHVVESFFKVVDEFISFNRGYLPNVKGGYIGVHCTHGLNRTGYLICSYMIQKLGFPPDKAIASFNAARGHQIERENYTESLMNMESNFE